eukprot:30877-Pelagococcus_subviridis.AAC.3
MVFFWRCMSFLTAPDARSKTRIRPLSYPTHPSERPLVRFHEAVAVVAPSERLSVLRAGPNRGRVVLVPRERAQRLHRAAVVIRRGQHVAVQVPHFHAKVRAAGDDELPVPAETHAPHPLGVRLERLHLLRPSRGVVDGEISARAADPQVLPVVRHERAVHRLRARALHEQALRRVVGGVRAQRAVVLAEDDGFSIRRRRRAVRVRLYLRDERDVEVRRLFLGRHRRRADGPAVDAAGRPFLFRPRPRRLRRPRVGTSEIWIRSTVVMSAVRSGGRARLRAAQKQFSGQLKWNAIKS